MPIAQQFDRFLDSASFKALLDEYSSGPLTKPCWLVVAAVDDADRIETRYGPIDSAKLIKWTALEVDFRIKRKDVIGFVSPGHLAILFYEDNLEKPADVLKITERFCRGLAEDQISEGFPARFKWPLKQSAFDMFYKDWEGFLVDIGNGDARIWWSRDRKMPKSDTTIGYKKSNFLDLKRRLRLLDIRVTISAGIARQHADESAKDWLARAMHAAALASRRKGNTAEVAAPFKA